MRRAVPLLVASALAIAGCGGSDDGGGSGDGDASGGGNERLFSSSGFGEALDAAGERAGDDARVIAIEVSDAGAEFSLLNDDGAEGLIYTDGELVDSEIAVVGGGPEGAGAFPLSEVDAGAVDAMVAGVAEASGATGLKIVAMTLEPDQAGDPSWTITATADAGDTLTYRARADGSDLQPADDETRAQPGSGSVPATPEPPAVPGSPQTPGAPSVEDAQAALECIEAAEGDVEQLQKCAALVQP